MKLLRFQRTEYERFRFQIRKNFLLPTPVIKKKKNTLIGTFKEKNIQRHIVRVYLQRLEFSLASLQDIKILPDLGKGIMELSLG